PGGRRRVGEYLLGDPAQRAGELGQQLAYPPQHAVRQVLRFGPAATRSVRHVDHRGHLSERLFTIPPNDSYRACGCQRRINRLTPGQPANRCEIQEMERRNDRPLATRKRAVPIWESRAVRRGRLKVRTRIIQPTSRSSANSPAATTSTRTNW